MALDSCLCSAELAKVSPAKGTAGQSGAWEVRAGHGGAGRAREERAA